MTNGEDEAYADSLYQLNVEHYEDRKEATQWMRLVMMLRESGVLSAAQVVELLYPPTDALDASENFIGMRAR